MEPKFQTSFIPKKSDTGIYTPSSIPINPVAIQNVDLFSVVAITLFVVALFAMGGLFGYEYYLKNQIKQSVANLDDAKKAFDVEKINELILADKKIELTKNLLENHIASSRVLALLEQSIVKKSQFDNFEFTKKTNKPQIIIKGETQSFNALVKQQEIFESTEYIKNPLITDVAVTKNGGVGYTLTAEIMPVLTSYRRFIEGKDKSNSTAEGEQPVTENSTTTSNNTN